MKTLNHIQAQNAAKEIEKDLINLDKNSKLLQVKGLIECARKNFAWAMEKTNQYEIQYTSLLITELCELEYKIYAA